LRFIQGAACPLRASGGSLERLRFILAWIWMVGGEVGYFKEPRMATSDRVRERIRELALKLALEDLDELDEEDGDCWLDAIENRAIEIGDALTAALIEERSRDRPCAGESLCPQ